MSYTSFNSLSVTHLWRLIGTVAALMRQTANRNIVGTRLRAIRLAKNLSQGRLARALQLRGMDLDRVAVMHIESGRRRVQDYELVGIAEVLKISVLDLIPEKIPPFEVFYPEPEIPD